MKKLLALFLSLSILSCTAREPTEREIEEAASRQLSRKLRCAMIAVHLQSTGEIENDNGEKVCYIKYPKNKDFPFIVLDEKEMEAIARYIYIKNSLNEKTN